MIGNLIDVAIKSDEYCFLWIDWWVTCLTKSEWAAWASFFAVAITLWFTYRSSKKNDIRINKKSQIAMRVLISQLRLVLEILEKLSRNNFPDERISLLNRLEQCYQKIDKYSDLAAESILHWGDYYFDALADINVKLQIACVDKRWNMGQDTDSEDLRLKINHFTSKYESEFEYKNGFNKTILEVFLEKSWYKRLIRQARFDQYRK